MSVRRDAWARKAMLLAALLLSGAAFAQPASANARLCRQLEADLASVRSVGGSVQYRKYDQAVTAQRQQISIARRQARSAGCGFSFLGGKSACGQINARIDKMERNLAALQLTRTRLAGGGNARRDRSRILAALDANGCRGNRLAERPRRQPKERNEGSASLFDRIVGEGRTPGTLEDSGRGARSSALNENADRRIRRALGQDSRATVGGSRGEFRTLCVRTCDGYFFPMSSASSTRDFDRDQKNCESVCPGAEILLYRHRAAGEESDAMVSAVTGKPYTALPTAYLYKAIGTPRPEGCGCNRAKNFSIIAGNPPDAATPAELTTPDPASDPGRPADVDGELSAEAAGPVLKPAPERVRQAAGQRKVRVVGPVFLPDPEGAIDLQAQARKTVR